MKKQLRIVAAAALGLAAFAGQGMSQSLWKPNTRYSSLIADRTARSVGDIVQVVIVDQESVQDKNNTKIERASSTSTTVKKAQLTRHIPLETNLPELEVEGSRKLDAKADANRSGTFTTIFSATVIDVMPNGNLILVGKKTKGLFEDDKELELTGVCRPYDITSDNTIASNKIADLRIRFVASGPVAEASQKGWLAKAWDVLWNFVWPF